MWDFLKLVFGWMSNLASGQLSTIAKAQESIMANIEQIKADLADVKANLEETQGDLNEILALNTQQSGQIASLESAVDALKVELAGKIADLSQVDVIAALVADVKATSRSVADVVAEPEPAPAPEPAPEPAPPEAA